METQSRKGKEKMSEGGGGSMATARRMAFTDVGCSLNMDGPENY